MNPFVNPHKRSVVLPDGCKDLIDVLRRRDPALENMPSPEIRPQRFEGVGLVDVERHVTKVVESPAKMVTLHIKSLDEARAVALVRSATEFSISPSMGIASQERDVREFFAGRRIEAIADFLADGPFPPIQILAFPMPPAAADAARLTVDLLREVYDFSDESGIEFTLVEYIQV